MIFLDTSYYIALINPKDPFYKKSWKILKELEKGVYGTPFTSNLVMSEAAILTAIRTKKNPEAIATMRSLFVGEIRIATMLRCSEDVELRAWDLFEKVNRTVEQPMSYVDCTNIVLAQQNHIGMIIAYDTHFEGWFQQIQ